MPLSDELLTKAANGYTDSLVNGDIVSMAMELKEFRNEKLPPTWQAVTKPGQVKDGNYLRFTIGNETFIERAKEILNPGTDKEEVIYHSRRNLYFITSMVMDGSSCQKNVEVFQKSSVEKIEAIMPSLDLSSIPAEIIEAERKLSRWFKENNITDWQLGGCMRRDS